jgi:tRNA-specific 2-thiouridylase
MSGGVDSSVAAALLAEQGYDVVGVTMRLWTEERPDELKGRQQCCSVEDIGDARRVAGQLGIRHYVLNFEDEFRSTVVDQFVSEYAAGRTPNPCVRCNEHIKYRALLDRLPALEADFMATGHYARVVRDPAPAPPGCFARRTPPRTRATSFICCGRSSSRGSYCQSAS